MVVRFIGRWREYKRLKLLLKKQSASFVVIRGRRRIGKSRLIEQFGHEAPCHLFSGLAPADGVTKQSQLDEFCTQLARAFGLASFQVTSWSDAFWHLGQQCVKGRRIVALDEISWMGSKDPEFLSHLKNAWDLYFSKNPKLILIVCGSVSSWIERNILSSTGFVGRISLDMQLEELPLKDAIEFWNSHKGRVAPYEMLKVLSVTGGVPRYLEEVMPSLPAEENIRQLCFDKEGVLFSEFDKIFSDLFSSKATKYIEILTYLAQGSRTIDEVAEKLDGGRHATVSLYLHDLALAGFVKEDPTWNLRTMKISNLKKFRISDNYVRFYLRYILPNRPKILKGLYKEMPLSRLPGWEAMIGLQFENLVLKNAFSLFELMGVQPADIVYFGPYFQRATSRNKGCQIDLLVQTRYRTLFLCEIKFRADKVGLSVVHEMLAKQKALAVPRGWSTRLVLVHVNGVTQEVLESQEVDHLIEFGELIQ